MVSEKGIAVALRQDAPARVGGNVGTLPLRGGRAGGECLKTHGYLRSSLRDGSTRPSGPVNTERARSRKTIVHLFAIPPTGGLKTLKKKPIRADRA